MPKLRRTKFTPGWFRRDFYVRSDIIDRMLVDQDFRCLYCLSPFGSILRTPHKHIQTQIEFDHIVPRSFNANHSHENLALVCSFCNRQKSDKVFSSVEAIRDFMKDIWRRRQITIFDVQPPVGFDFLASKPSWHTARSRTK